MPNGRTAIVADLGDLFTVQIDPTWKYRSLWGSPVGQKLSIGFLDLSEGISESAQVNYAGASIIGRAEEIKTYLGNSNREVTLDFQFQVQGIMGSDAGTRVGGANLSALSAPTRVNTDGVQSRDDTGGLAEQLDKEVVQKAKFLDALKFPLRTEVGISVGPPRVLLTIGQLLVMRCIVVNSVLNWRGPFDPNTLLPYAAAVQVTFASTADQITEYNFDGPSRWKGVTDPAVLGGVDGPANPFSDLGRGISGTDNIRSTAV